MATPKRPHGIPTAAIFDPQYGNWEMGGERHGLRVGEWRWWRKDESLWAICRFDDRGRLHGLTERFHKSGEAASLVP